MTCLACGIVGGVLGILIVLGSVALARVVELKSVGSLEGAGDE